MLVPLTRGLFAIIDDEDWPLVSQYTWQAITGKRGKRFYAVHYFKREGKRGQIFLHKLVVGAGKDQRVDHKSNDSLDCRKANLRPVTTVQNAWNRGPREGRRFKGIFLHKPTGRYRAAITREGKRHYLGYFDTPEAAATAYDRASRELHGEYASLNFPLAA